MEEVGRSKKKKKNHTQRRNPFDRHTEGLKTETLEKKKWREIAYHSCEEKKKKYSVALHKKLKITR